MIELKYNFDTPDFALETGRWLVWRDLPNNDHAWAFIHYCRLCGDIVYVKGDKKHLNVGIKKALPFK